MVVGGSVVGVVDVDVSIVVDVVVVDVDVEEVVGVQLGTFIGRIPATVWEF